MPDLPQEQRESPPYDRNNDKTIVEQFLKEHIGTEEAEELERYRVQLETFIKELRFHNPVPEGCDFIGIVEAMFSQQGKDPLDFTNSKVPLNIQLAVVRLVLDELHFTQDEALPLVRSVAERKWASAKSYFGSYTPRPNEPPLTSRERETIFQYLNFLYKEYLRAEALIELFKTKNQKR
jgi:hypothetical protein